MEILKLLGDNWQIVLIIFYVAEKVVKLTPSKKDDILVDIVIKGLGRLIASKKESNLP